MQISLKHGFAFLCTPKCASNSIEDMLRPHIDIDLQGSPAVRHTNVEQYRRLLVPYLAEIAPATTVETVALVREPVSWLYSWYRFRARSELREQQHPNSTAHVDFAGFIEAYLSATPPAFARVGSQAEFLLDETGIAGVDHLYAYEHVPALVEFLGRRIGQPLSLRAINVSPTRVYKSNLLERVGAMQRRLRSRLVRETHSARAPAHDSRTDLEPALRAALAERLAADFRLHQAARREAPPDA